MVSCCTNKANDSFWAKVLGRKWADLHEEREQNLWSSNPLTPEQITVALPTEVQGQIGAGYLFNYYQSQHNNLLHYMKQLNSILIDGGEYFCSCHKTPRAQNVCSDTTLKFCYGLKDNNNNNTVVYFTWPLRAIQLESILSLQPIKIVPNRSHNFTGRHVAKSTNVVCSNCTSLGLLYCIYVTRAVSQSTVSVKLLAVLNGAWSVVKRTCWDWNRWLRW